MTAPSPAALQALTGRRETALLELPSVARAANLLAERCSASWVRLAVTSLDRFRVTCVGEVAALESLLDSAREDREVGVAVLAGFAHEHRRESSSQVEALAFGVKVWFALSGVEVPWSPLRPLERTRGAPHGDLGDGDLRLLLPTSWAPGAGSTSHPPPWATTWQPTGWTIRT